MGLLHGKIALVTGAGSGLGRATAIALAREGAQLVLCGRRLDPLKETLKLISEANGDGVAIAADVSSAEDVTHLTAEAVAEFGRIDILINNAAVFEPGGVTDTDLQNWNDQLAVNLTGPFLLMQAILPWMRKQNYGRIVNITSGLAYNGAGGFAAYSASKAGLESLTRTVADEESGNDILANLFNPGTVRSNMHATGQDPSAVAPEIVKLASLAKGGMSGQLVSV
ncbi:short-chain dehydrogenase [Paenibacillus swuensis]|uniref:Short-chain dehydrogenase n=1 Tax=Paenibacillus swuensis TaxID=1178515 RepID=A0A172TGI8_9BACL|nr:SDR family oxidoreductase [Paenibacillus swuensis]ANE46169.1 short-chain dehydrogenase [Paenibacillus swuensis]